MTLTPLAFFDLLEAHAAEWLPPLAPPAAWRFQRMVDFGLRKAVLQISSEPPAMEGGASYLIEAREAVGEGLEGHFRVSANSKGQRWHLHQGAGGQWSQRALELAYSWLHP